MRIRLFWPALGAAFALWTAPGLAQQGVGDVVYVPTPQAVVDAMLEMARVSAGDFVIDLGSGDGRMVITAAKRFGARALGVELDRYLLGVARANAAKEGVADRAEFREENLFRTDLSAATVITTYLLPEMNLKLRPRILELAPGTRVVAHDYHMGEWYPDENRELPVPEKKVGSPGVSYLYLWYVPAKIQGVWRGRGPEGEWELAATQRFQYFSGVLRTAKGSYRVEDGRLRGGELRFAFRAGTGPRQEFSGAVHGDTLTGTTTVQRAGKPIELRWEARRASG